MPTFGELMYSVRCLTVKICEGCWNTISLGSDLCSDDDSNHESASIQPELLRPNAVERVMLIELFWENLEEQRVKEIAARWAAESEDQIDAYGDLPSVDGPWVLRSSLRNESISADRQISQLTLRS
jgi:hypothetical protein